MVLNKGKVIIREITAREILDSRGNPTVEASIELENGLLAVASVPSGASTGTREAVELRDGDKKRFGGKGVKKAIGNIENIIGPHLEGFRVSDQAKLDQAMVKLDGTDDKRKLGANAILAVSMAAARACAATRQIPLYKHLSKLFGYSVGQRPLPQLMINVLNGGKHASGSFDMQEYMLVPQTNSPRKAVRIGSEVFHTLGKLIHDQGLPTTVGDEGGYAPKLADNQKPLRLLVEAINQAGYQPGMDVAIALDPAATSFFQDGQYYLESEKRTLSSAEMIQLYTDWINTYPIISIEDGLAEDDWRGFTDLTQTIGQHVQIVGDDLFVTSTQLLQQGIDQKAANSILIKLNQIGTLTETLAAISLARKSKFSYIISHRSGETTDDFIADLAVATAAPYIKTGSISRGERVVKYNRLMKIQAELS